MAFASNWLGPQYFENEMRSLGFNALSAYKNYWINRCKCRNLPSDIDKYWYESAKEFVSSGGYGSGGSAFFRGAHLEDSGVYRSTYLDELEKKSGSWVQPNDIAPKLAIHPCSYYFLLKMRSNSPEAWDENYEQIMEDAKLDETHVKFPVDRPLLSMEDIEYYLRLASDHYGLRSITLKGKIRAFAKVGFFVDCAAPDLRILLTYDSKQSFNSLPRPLIETFIYPNESPDLIRNLAGFKVISPTMLAYSNFISSQCGVINIYAAVAAAKTLGASLG